MKQLLSVLAIGLAMVSFGQDTTEVKKVGQKRAVTTPADAFPAVSFRKLDNDVISPDNITGEYIIERYAVQVKTSETKKAIGVVGTELVIDNYSIVGSEIDSMEFQFSDSEYMNIEDYLYRIFGLVPEDIPDDLPTNIIVHKTNNLDCYGIGELSDGTVLIPYNGLLLYLRRS